MLVSFEKTTYIPTNSKCNMRLSRIGPLVSKHGNKLSNDMTNLHQVAL